MDLKKLPLEKYQRIYPAQAFVLQVLRQAIIRGLLPGGYPLRQDEVSSQLGVSHIPVREALRQLESQGLVTFYPHRGAVVATLSPEETREIFQIRIFLETGALRLSIPRLTDKVLQDANRILKIAEEEDDVDSWSELNWEFHAHLYQPAGYPRLLKLIEELHANVNRYLRIYLSLMDFQARSQAEHQELLAACANRDVSLAAHILEQHLQAASNHLEQFLSSTEEEPC